MSQEKQRVLSIRQPHAEAIMRGVKKIEYNNQADFDEIGVSFFNLPARQQLQVLAEVALFVCLHAQVNHDGLASLNALQLTLITRIMRLAASHPLLMPDSAFIDQLFREAKRAGFERKLASAFQQCLTVAQPTPPVADKEASEKKSRRGGRRTG